MTTNTLPFPSMVMHRGLRSSPTISFRPPLPPSSHPAQSRPPNQPTDQSDFSVCCCCCCPRFQIFCFFCFFRFHHLVPRVIVVADATREDVEPTFELGSTDPHDAHRVVEELVGSVWCAEGRRWFERRGVGQQRAMCWFSKKKKNTTNQRPAQQVTGKILQSTHVA